MEEQTEQKEAAYVGEKFTHFLFQSKSFKK